ncbi:MAG: metallo-mystery pair system four-Cys motif protein [Acidobacteria bacterium]|nr:metallo-mystery pair system four-Cys motif protein [Acidobacteriota bacterium]
MNKKNTNRLLLSVLLLLSGVSVFGQDNQNLEVNFEAVFGDQLFKCGEIYKGIGTTNSEMSVTDLRLFIQDVRLTNENGEEVSFNFVSDGKFQSEKVAMLDFENGKDGCDGGTSDLNTSISGMIPKGKYKGLKFKIGVPEELNHLDPTFQPAPLNISKMMWSWQLGYKFLRIDTKTIGMPGGYVLHLGSTECKTDAVTNRAECKNANRPEFVLENFDPAKEVVKIDLKALFANANVDSNQDKTALGCMSFEVDRDCDTVFKNLGLAFRGNAAGRQNVVRSGKPLANTTGQKNSNNDEVKTRAK